MQMMRLTRAAVAALSLLIVIGPLALAGRTAERICPNVVVDGAWSSIAAPAFTEGGADLTAFAVHPQLPFVLYATNGQQVKISDDSGCTWKDFFSVGLLPTLGSTVSSANSRVKSIEIPENPIGPAPVYLLIEQTIGPIVRPHVVTSGQGGGLDLLSGLPQATGGVYGLHIAPSEANVLYLHVRSNPASVQDDIYRSNDGGGTWTKRNGDQATASQGLAVDPLNENEIWTFGADGLYRSSDGGETRAFMDQVGPPVPLVDIFHPPGRPQRVMAYEAETATVNMTHDGGKTWTRFMGPGGSARSWAHGNEEDQLLFAQHLRVDDYKPPSFWDLVSADYEQEDLSDLQADRSRFPSVFGFTARTIEKYTGWNENIELPDISDLDPAEIVDESSLVPAETRLRLQPGDSKKVDYTFTLPPNAVPLDVFFLVDTSSSMDSSIAGLRKGMQSIISALEDSGIDAMYGAGEIKDYPIPGFGDPQAGDFPYRLNRAIGPVNDELSEALTKMDASGGGTVDYEESQLTGLYQATTGAGEPGCAAEVSEEGQPCVPPGQGANFRPDAVKVIVNITDYGFHDQAAHPSPPFAQVAQALSAQDVKQIGLAIYGAEAMEGMNAAVADLSEMAEETGTLAADPVDCDGDGDFDVGAGKPLVCRVTDMVDNDTVNIAPAIIETVKAVVQEVKVELVRSDGKPITDVEPAVYPTVDVTEQNALGFALTFTCPRRLAGTTQDLTLAAKVQGGTVATAAATVTCAKLPKAAIVKKPKQPPPPPPPVVPVFPPAPIAIPALAPAGPPPVPETISSTQSAAQAQGAVAKQEQQQLQFAVAYAAFRNDEAYALSSYVERRGPSPAPLYLTAAMMSLAAAFVAVSGRRTHAAVARVRRR